MKVGPGIVYYSFNISALFFVIAKASDPGGNAGQITLEYHRPPCYLMVIKPWKTMVEHVM